MRGSPTSSLMRTERSPSSARAPKLSLVVGERVDPSAAAPASARVPRTAETSGTLDEDLFAAIEHSRIDWQRMVFERYERLVRSLLFKALGSRTEVDDLLGEVFARFFESASNIRSAEGLRSYLVSVAMNTARDELRRRKRRQLLFWKDEANDELGQAPGHADPAAEAALRELFRLLLRLGTEEREAYTLHELGGVGLVDVAEELGLSLSTVKRRVRRADNLLRSRAARSALLADYLRAPKRNADRSDVVAPSDLT